MTVLRRGLPQSEVVSAGPQSRSRSELVHRLVERRERWNCEGRLIASAARHSATKPRHPAPGARACAGTR